MKMKRIAAITAGLILASGTTLMAMGNKNDSDRNVGARESDASYSSGVSTGLMMRGAATNKYNTGASDFGTSTKSGSGMGSGSSTLGTGAGTGTGSGTGGNSF